MAPQKKFDQKWLHRKSLIKNGSTISSKTAEIKKEKISQHKEL